MTSLKLLFIACLIFGFSLCVNEDNGLINSFRPTHVDMHCHDYVGNITIEGLWNNYNIPHNVSFTLNLKDGHNFECSFTSQDPNVITCHIDHVKFHIDFNDQYMDANQQFLIIGCSSTVTFDCLSSYIYSNLLLLFIIIFILFN